jgi:nucleoid-associated protein YgaU
MKFYLESVTATYTMFSIDGTPIRATCDITLIEWSNPASRQNPTSGGLPGMETHVLIDGETLHSVAWARYGEAGFWRALADFNGIDDPLRVEPGTTLLIPPRREAAALSS